jgi:hypothetical protein
MGGRWSVGPTPNLKKIHIFLGIFSIQPLPSVGHSAKNTWQRQLCQRFFYRVVTLGKVFTECI